MARAAYGDQEAVRASEVHRADHVGDTGAPDDKVGAPVDHCVMDLAGGIVAVVSGTDQRATQTGLEFGDRRFVRSFTVMNCHPRLLTFFDSELLRNAGSAHAFIDA